MEFAQYDEMLGAIYSAAAGTCPLADMFIAVRTGLNATAAGVSIYDQADEVITHTIYRSARTPSRGLIEQITPLTSDPSASLFTAPNLPIPRRFTDLIPEPRLRNAPWFRRQVELTGTVYGLAVDVRIHGIRIRLFAVRPIASENFNDHESDLLHRLAKHVERAFAASLRRFSPFAQAGGLVTLLFLEDRLASPFLRRDDFERLMVSRFDLSGAELRVLRVMADGPTRAQAAARLGIGENTLKTHMRRIYANTGTTRLAELILQVRALQGEA